MFRFEYSHCKTLCTQFTFMIVLYLALPFNFKYLFLEINTRFYVLVNDKIYERMFHRNDLVNFSNIKVCLNNL